MNLPCEIYARLAKLANNVEAERQQMKAVCIEIHNGNMIAIATNYRLASIEYVGKSDGPNGQTYIVTDPKLIAQCEIEAPFQSIMQIIPNPVLGFTAIKTSLGFNYAGNGAVIPPKPNFFETWRTWLPDALPVKTNGAMLMNADDIKSLAASSVSGDIVFPEFIDIKKPIILRDANSENWFGLFMGAAADGSTAKATIPKWIGE